MSQQELTKPTTAIDRAWAILFARLVLGLIFFMAGVMKVFQLGPLNHARKYFLPFADTFLPVWSLWAMGGVIPFVELIAGAMVIGGLRVGEAFRRRHRRGDFRSARFGLQASPIRLTLAPIPGRGHPKAERSC